MAINYNLPSGYLTRRKKMKKLKNLPGVGQHDTPDMVDVLSQTVQTGVDFLSHFGVKGMRWGVRRSDKELHGGGSPHTHEDHANAKAAQQKIKKHGVKSVSNKELQDAINRMNLEQSYARAKAADTTGGKFKKGHEAVKTVLDVGGTALKIHGMVTNPATKAGARIVAGAVRKAAKK